MASKRMAQAAATKQKLLDMGTRLFNSQSLEDTSVDDIVAACGVSKGTFYHYFSSKEDFVFFIEHHAYSEAREQLAQVAGLTVDECLTAYVRAFFDRVEQCSTGYYIRWFVREIENDPTTSGKEPMFAFNRGHVDQILRDGVARGELVEDAPVEDLSLMMTTCIYGSSLQGYLDPETFVVSEWADDLAFFLCHALDPYRR